MINIKKSTQLKQYLKTKTGKLRCLVVIMWAASLTFILPSTVLCFITGDFYIGIVNSIIAIVDLVALITYYRIVKNDIYSITREIVCKTECLAVVCILKENYPEYTTSSTSTSIGEFGEDIRSLRNAWLRWKVLHDEPILHKKVPGWFHWEMIKNNRNKYVVTPTDFHSRIHHDNSGEYPVISCKTRSYAYDIEVSDIQLYTLERPIPNGTYIDAEGNKHFDRFKKEETKVIFLDVDGVLNGYTEWNRLIIKISKKLHIKPKVIKDLLGIFEVKEKYVKRLSKIVKATDAKIVLSSTWKIDIQKHSYEKLDKRTKRLPDLLSKYGLEIMDTTPNLPSGDRVEEIKLWLTQTNLNVGRFVILDDEKIISYPFNYHFIHTKDYSGNEGLKRSDIEKAIAKLK